MRTFALASSILLALAGCAPTSAELDAALPVDAARIDASMPDSALVDTGTRDAAESDAAIASDAGPTILTLTGHDFGVGPEVFLYHSMREGTDGAELTSLDPEIGAYAGSIAGMTAGGVGWPRYVTHAGRRVMEMRSPDGADQNMRGVVMRFDATPSFFISYRVTIPPDAHFPGAAAPRTPGARSNWKIAWFNQGGVGSGAGSDLVVPTAVSGGLHLIGNQSAHTWWGPGIAMVWDWDDWNVVTCSHIAEGDPRSEPGDVVFAITTPRTGTTVRSWRDTLIREDTPVAGFDRLYFPAWIGNDDDTHEGTQAYFADLYLALGEHAQARVELCDAPEWDACRHRFVVPPLEWTEDTIRVAPHPSELAASTHWFVTTATGERYAGALADL
ncbi:hypothetical protein [Sandaracinus amylolyticus]|uniref:Uncharacterized protein n=1 Tax=Sandaracinus amylolyticus TaxID=927083 RepID=A0A0F6SGH6_9BACT|nr:hypothetical protein [Sandaracinus amylolyticus]AKF08709.1 hypothetical protein DB32_005858 [Sandaracinus amylolyticus]